MPVKQGPKIVRRTRKIGNHDNIEDMGGVQSSIFDVAPLHSCDDSYPIIYRTENEFIDLLSRSAVKDEVVWPSAGVPHFIESL